MFTCLGPEYARRRDRDWRTFPSLSPVLFGSAASANARREFTRQEFANVLGAVGAVAEQWLESNGGRLGLDERARTDGLRGVVQIRLHDLGGWWEWWCTRIRDSFPTFAKFDGLGLDYVPRE